jgi:hypothetical protein
VSLCDNNPQVIIFGRKKSNFLVVEVHFLGEEVQVQKAEIFLAFWCAQKRSLPRANFSHWRSHLAL